MDSEYAFADLHTHSEVSGHTFQFDYTFIDGDTNKQLSTRIYK